MARARALTPDDEDELAEIWPEIGTKRSAEHFGVSQNTIKRAVTRLGIREGTYKRAPRPKPKPEPQEDEEEDDHGPGRLAKLKRLEALLSAQLQDAPPGAVASISKEYRSVLDDIAREEGDQESDPFELLAASIAAKLHP